MLQDMEPAGHQIYQRLMDNVMDNYNEKIMKHVQKAQRGTSSKYGKK